MTSSVKELVQAARELKAWLGKGTAAVNGAKCETLTEALDQADAAIAAVEAEGDGWIDVKQELPTMGVSCSWDDPHHKGGFTTSELVETWHPNASADRTTLQGQRKFQRRISYLKDKDSNWVHADATHWRYPAAPPLPSPRSRYE